MYFLCLYKLISGNYKCVFYDKQVLFIRLIITFSTIIFFVSSIFYSSILLILFVLPFSLFSPFPFYFFHTMTYSPTSMLPCDAKLDPMDLPLYLLHSSSLQCKRVPPFLVPFVSFDSSSMSLLCIWLIMAAACCGFHLSFHSQRMDRIMSR